MRHGRACRIRLSTQGPTGTGAAQPWVQGFKGSRGTFYLPNEAGDHALLTFQKDKDNTRHSCRFTINLAFYSRHDWDQARISESWLPERPKGTGYLVGWEERIGFLMTPPDDRWFSVYNRKSAVAVSTQTLTLVQDLVLPEFSARIGKPAAP